MKTIFGAVLALGTLSATCISVSAATLDDVMARLESMQRDNQAIRRDNEAMRKELSALRKNEQRTPRPVAAPESALSRTLPASATSAMAAVPARGSYVEPPQAFTWSGFYLGVHAGYGWGSNEWGRSPIIELGGATFGSPLSPETNGILGGIQGGANLQIQNWVLGIAADLAFMHADNKRDGVLSAGGAPAPGVTTSGRSQMDWLATFTGRAGYAFDRSLFYVKGGIAAAGYTDSMSLTSTGAGIDFFDFGAKDNTRVGWTVGAGWEYAFAPNWSALIEYNYLDFGTTSEIFSNLGSGLSFQQEIKHTLHIVKAGVNYRF